MGKVAVITGGAGGLGRALTSKLQAEGWNIVLVDLPSDQLKSLEREQVEVMGCDLADDEANRKAMLDITKRYSRIDLVIYAVGITHIAPFEELELGAHRKLFDVNYFSIMNSAQHLLKAVRDAKGCHIVVSSVAGFAPLCQRVSYSASKHALEGAFSTIAAEESKYDVSTLIVSPSFIATNLDDDQKSTDGFSRPGSAKDSIDLTTPEAAAECILRGYSKRKSRIFVGRVSKLSWIISRLSPSLYRWLMMRQFRG